MSLVVHSAIVLFSFWGHPVMLSLMPIPGSIFNFSTSMPVPENFVLNGLYNKHKVIVISQCGFALYFPDNYWYWAPFICLLTAFFYLGRIVSSGPMLIFNLDICVFKWRCWYTCLQAKLLQSCQTLWDSMECNTPGSPIHGILQRRIVESVAMPSLLADLPDPAIEPTSHYPSCIGRQVLYH